MRKLENIDLPISPETKRFAASTLQCETCNKEFNTAGQLKRHEQSHYTKKKKFDKCEKSFIDHSHLLTHVKSVHENRKLHQCSVCNQSFNNGSNLKRHINNMHGEQNHHICSLCQKSFTRKDNLKTHLNICKHKPANAMASSTESVKQ